MAMINQDQFIDWVANKVDLDSLANEYIKHIHTDRNKGRGIPIEEKDQLIKALRKAHESFFRFVDKFETENKTILELGSGFGGFVLLGNLHGVKTCGVEPDRKMAWLTKQMLVAFGFDRDLVQPSPGETLPFEENNFDYVVSFQVLEHVEDPAKVLDESIRVLKPEGHLYFIFPNYNSFYEGHIKKIWFPFINKRNVKKYLKLLGINEDKLKYVNFLTPMWVRDYLKDYNDKIKLISLGEKEFVNDYFCESNVSKIGNKYLAWLFKLFFLLRINRPVARLLLSMQWYYPVVLFVKKQLKTGGREVDGKR